LSCCLSSDSSLLQDQFTFLKYGQLNTLALWKSDFWVIARANDENILLTSGERVAGNVTDSHNVEGSWVMFNVNNGANTSSVTSLCDHSHLARFEFDEIDYFTGFNINLDNIISLDDRIGVSDGATVVSNNIWDFLVGHSQVLNSAKLELLLLIGDAVKDESTLGVENKSKLITSLWDFNDIHKTSREVGVSSGFTINLDELFHANHLGFLAGKGVFQSISQNQDERKGLSQLVRTLRRSWGPDAVHLGKHPVLGSIQSLQVLLRTSGHFSILFTMKSVRLCGE